MYLPNRLVEILAVHIERIGTGVAGWLFCTADDRPIPPSTVDSWWQKTLRDAERLVYISTPCGTSMRPVSLQLAAMW